MRAQNQSDLNRATGRSQRRGRDAGERDDYTRGDSGGAFDAGGPLPGRAGTMKAYAYRGLGPRGYRRSDTRIHEDVCETLTDDPHIDASELEVEVQDGEVTLSGTVHSRQQKRHAEDLAEMITGVKDVHNRLRVVIAENDLAAKGSTSSPMSPNDLTA